MYTIQLQKGDLLLFLYSTQCRYFQFIPYTLNYVSLDKDPSLPLNFMISLLLLCPSHEIQQR